MIHSAKAKGEIEESFLKSGLSRWLDSQSFHIPREKAERFCQEALKLERLPSSLLSSPEVNKLAEEMSYINTRSMKDSSMQPVSTLIENQKGENLSDILNYHIIKWCKLYLMTPGQAGRCQTERKACIVHGTTLLHLIQRSVKMSVKF